MQTIFLKTRDAYQGSHPDPFKSLSTPCREDLFWPPVQRDQNHEGGGLGALLIRIANKTLGWRH